MSDMLLFMAVTICSGLLSWAETVRNWLRVTAITDALSAPIASNSQVDVYTTDGICLFLRRPYSEVRSTLRPGTYVLVFGNTSRKIIVKNLAQFRE